MGHGRIASAAKQPLWAVTIWDKKFNSVAPGKQKSAIKYHYLLAGDLKEKIVPGGDVKLLTTSETDWWTTEDKVVGLVSEGEIVSIPWGGNPNVQYFKGRFVTADNRIATSSDKGILDNKFLYYFMLSKRNTIGSFYRGAGLKHPEMSKVLDMEIPLPSIEVQRSFARCMDNVAKVIAIRKTQLESLSQLVKSRFVEMFGEPTINSKGWPVARLSELGELNRGVSKARPRNSPDLLGGPYPLVQTGEVANSGLYIRHYNATYSEKGLAQSRLWNSGTLCITIAANIAQTSILTFDACFPDSVVGFVANERTIPVFIHFWFAFFQHILEAQAPQVAQKNINLKILSELNVIEPPIALQREFAAFVAKVDKLAFATRRRRDLAQQMYRAKIQEFFG